jgi:diguanylate cyclase (GGDEF)-like protein
MSYRSRLFLYAGMLMVLLIGMMILSFKAARDVIVTGSQEHLRHMALHNVTLLESQVEELKRFAGLLAGDLELQEFLQQGTAGADDDTLRRAHYERRFSLLPGDSTLILDAGGNVLLGHDYRQLVGEVRQRDGMAAGRQFFFESAQGVMMVATSPVSLAGAVVGTVVVARLMDQRWLTARQPASSEYVLFFERRGRVLWSSNERFDGIRFDNSNRRLAYEGDRFRLHEIPYGKPLSGLPRLWFGVSETGITRLVASYQRWVFSFAVLGSLVVLMVGWLLLRNFSRPMAALMMITEQMMKGELPVMVRSEAKSEMDRLVNRFADVLDSLRREQSKLESANRKLQETAITDSLTGLYNRRYMQEVTPGLFAQVVRDRRYLTAVLIDLDFFKAINDSWGHLGGDAVLVHFGQLLQHNSRANDFLFRIGGEEFLILNVAENTRESVALAEKIRELVSRSPATYQGKTIPITVSIGISCCYGRSGDISLSMLMRAADKALYEAKTSGRNRVVQHSSCREAAAGDHARARITLIDGSRTT